MMLGVKELKKMGPNPYKYSNQVAWLTELMGELQRLVELGDQDDDLVCRICKQLEKQRGQTNLFLNHLGKFTHGCPKFITMSLEERLKVCNESQICLVCISHKVTCTPAHMTDCSVRKSIQDEDKSR